jgi:hypothetical protein
MVLDYAAVDAAPSIGPARILTLLSRSAWPYLLCGSNGLRSASWAQDVQQP